MVGEENQWREWVWDISSEMCSGEGEQRSKREKMTEAKAKLSNMAATTHMWLFQLN